MKCIFHFYIGAPFRNPCTYNTSVQRLIIKGTTTACLCDAQEKATIQAGGCTLWGRAVFAGISPPPGAPSLYREVLSCILYQVTLPSNLQLIFHLSINLGNCIYACHQVDFGGVHTDSK